MTDEQVKRAFQLCWARICTLEQRLAECEQANRDNLSTPEPSQDPTSTAQSFNSFTQHPTLDSPPPKRAKRIPKDWRPGPTHWPKAEEHGLDIMREAEHFRSHAEAKDRKVINWDAAFHMWLLQAIKYGERDLMKGQKQPRPEFQLEGVTYYD